jgi:hypothetical protein
MLFPYSFRKAYLANPVGGNLVVQTSGTTDVVQKGQFGFCLAPNGIEGSFISSSTTTSVKMVTGSWHTVDKIAPFYGGLQAPEYSKLIDFRRVTRFIQSIAAVAAQQIVSIGWDQTSGSTVGPVFYCGTPYFLRLDFLGSPALRLLNHQIYINLPAYGGCCGTDCSSGCTSTAVDAACIMLQWKDFIMSGTNGQNIPEVPYLKEFFLPQVFIKDGSTKTEVFSAADVADGRAGGNTAYVCNTADPTSVIASFQLTGAYVQTTYGNCTFTPSDYFEIEPIFAHASLVTQDFTPCAYNTTINTSVPNMFTVLQAPVYPKGLGEQVVREIILSQSYRQDYFSDSMRVDSLRMREIENQSWILDNINRQGYYDSIAIVYNIFRPNNSQGITDNDEYCEIIYMPTGTNATTFTTLFQACLTAVGSPVTLEKTASDGSGI